jgi:hypothetical protein
VIGLAGVDETGLKDVASAANYPFFVAAQTDAKLPAMLDDIQEQTTADVCIPAGGNVWQSTVPQERAASIPPPLGPLVYPTVGRVYLRDQNGNRLPAGPGSAPISVDAQTGRLTYRFDNLAPGIYQLSGFVVYKGDDGITRVYAAVFDPNTQTTSASRTIAVPPAAGPAPIVALPTLYLDLNGSVCPRT